MPQTFGGALALLLIGAVVGATIAIVASKDKGKDSGSTPAPVSQSQPNREDIAKAAADRQAEVEREEEARRQRELARQESMDRMKKSILNKSRENVKACASIARQRTDSRTYKGSSTFDAYVTGEYGETVQFFGTADERFQFEKCMADRGAPLSKQSSDTSEK